MKHYAYNKNHKVFDWSNCYNKNQKVYNIQSDKQIYESPPESLKSGILKFTKPN